jgi:hypothetical protein
MMINALATYPQLRPPPRASVIAAAPESQNIQDRNRLTGVDALMKRVEESQRESLINGQ